MGRRAKDRVGMRYGRLVCVRLLPSVTKAARWQCVCDCGQEHVANAHDLVNGFVQSCGCLRRENARLQGKRYGGPRQVSPTHSFAALEAAWEGR